MYFSKQEKKIIKPFCDYINSNLGRNEIYHIIWRNNTEIYAKIVSIDEDDNELDLMDDKYEEFWSIIIKIIKCVSFDKRDGFNLDYFKEGNLSGFNYHNFPDKIYNSKGELISKKPK